MWDLHFAPLSDATPIYFDTACDRAHGLGFEAAEPYTGVGLGIDSSLKRALLLQIQLTYG